MSLLRDAAVRFSPMRATVFFEKPLVAPTSAATAAATGGPLADAQADDMNLDTLMHLQHDGVDGKLAEQLLLPPGDNQKKQRSADNTIVEKEPKAASAVGPAAAAAANKYTEDGLPILAMCSCTIPDPCISTAGHAWASFYFYASFLLAVGYAIWRFATFEKTIAVSMARTASLGLNFPLFLDVACGAATNVTLLVNYTAAACLLPPMLFNSTNISNVPSPPEHVNSSVWSVTAPVGGSGGITTFVAPLCYALQQDVVLYHARWPAIAGVALAFDKVPWGTTCQISVSAVTATAPLPQPQPVQVLSVEGGVVKTFFASYTVEKIVEDDMRVAAATLEPVYYELDGLRVTNNIEYGKPGADSSAVVAVRLSEVSRSVSIQDDRTGFKLLSFFGQVWGLVGKAMLVLGPLLVVACPRDFVADAKAGKIDGYTKFLLDDAWKPGMLAGFGLSLYQRLQALSKQ